MASFGIKKNPVVEAANNEMLFKALKNIIFELIRSQRLVITMHFIETMVLLSMMIAFFFLGHCFYKGRPSRTKNITETQKRLKQQIKPQFFHNVPTKLINPS